MEASECDGLFPLSDSNLPWLMQLYDDTDLYDEIDQQEFMGLYSHCIIKKNITQHKEKIYLGCFGNWLLLADELTNETFFLHRTLDPKLKVSLPSLWDESYNCHGGCVVSSSPTSHKCVVFFVQSGSNDILYCRPKLDRKWTTLEIPDYSNNPGYCFTGQVVRFMGKIYMLHGSRGASRVVVVNEDLLLKGDCSSTIIQMPNKIDGWHHLVVSGRDMFLVLVTAGPLGRSIPTTCTIYRLKTSDQTWEHSEDIGGRVFFVGGARSSALRANRAGSSHCDCVYVVNHRHGRIYGEGVYKISLQNKTVSLSLLLKRSILSSEIYKLCWLMPIKVNRYDTKCSIYF